MERDLNSKLTMSLDDVIKTDPAPRNRGFRGGDSRPRRDDRPRRDFRPRRDERPRHDDRRDDRRGREEVRMRIDEDRSRSRSRDVRMGDGARSSGAVELRRVGARRSPSPDGRKIIKVGNLPSGVTWRDLKDAFGGPLIEHADVDGPVGFLKFKDSTAALKAIREYDGGNLNGNKIYVRYA